MSDEGFDLQTEQPIPLDWRVPDDLVTRYATNLVIQHTEHEFTIMFFEAKKPVIIGPEPYVQAKLDDLDCIPADCVARVVVAPERMGEFAQVFQDSYRKHQTSKEGS